LSEAYSNVRVHANSCQKHALIGQGTRVKYDEILKLSLEIK
jgi:hypothetical protein